MAPIVKVFLGESWTQATDQRLRRAGLEFTLTSPQFYATRIIACGICGPTLSIFVDAYAPLLTMGTPPVWSTLAIGAIFGWIYPAIWMSDREAVRRAELMKALPFFLDIITLCVEAGLNLPGALKQAVEKGPKGILRNEFIRVLRDVRAGATRADALRSMAERLAEPDVTHFISATILAEGMGASLAPVLRAQADQRRAERFIRAEKQAMQAPVKMLLPLILCIFPCTMIVILLPIAVRFLQSGY
jgi:tight adherence protein C